MSGNFVEKSEIHPLDLIKEGWLLKQSKYLRDWRRRWIVLTSSQLLSFKGPADLTNPTESLTLSQCTTVKSADEETQKANVFRVDTVDRVFMLIASSPQEKEAWIGAIGRQMIASSCKGSYCEEDVVY